jgi:type II secretory pathway component GspD/PulD (secretin)
MNLTIHKRIATLVIASTLGLPFAVKAEEKVQKITFIEDDAQKNMASKIYTLKHTRAADVAPFIRSAVIRYCEESNVSTVKDTERNRELLIVSTGIDMLKYVDKLVSALDRPAKFVRGTNITGNGIAYGVYQPQYRATKEMLDIIVAGEVSSGEADSEVKLDKKRNMFYFKDTPAAVDDIKAKLAWLDKPIPQVRLEMKVYQVRDSDLKDMGIDYLAWKNGPGLDLFNVAYNSLHIRNSNSANNVTSNFGGFYSAPAFDMSFIRILQQNGKATISSTANVIITNNREQQFKVSFAPEYQNFTKDENHTSALTIGGDSSLSASISDAIITSGKDGCVIFNCEITNNNVVERNNTGAELIETENISAHTITCLNKEQLLASWNRKSTVEQNVGIPFFSKIPVLKYLFGTTTGNTETNRFFVTVRAVPVVFNENMSPGTVSEFDKLAGK